MPAGVREVRRRNASRPSAAVSFAASSCWDWPRATAAAMPRAALHQAAGLYEVAKVNVNHPKGNPLAARDYQDRLGAIRNVDGARRAGAVRRLALQSQARLAEQLLWDATHAPENVGFSRNISRRPRRKPVAAPWSRRFSKCKASTWWPIRPRRAGCMRPKVTRPAKRVKRTKCNSTRSWPPAWSD